MLPSITERIRAVGGNPSEQKVMPYTTELTEDCLGIVHIGRGVLTSDELLQGTVVARQLVQNTENFNYELLDLSRVTELRIDPEDLGKIVVQDQIAAEERPHATIVIIAPLDDAYEMARRWEEMVSDLDWIIHISRDRIEALHWLAMHRQEAARDLQKLRQEKAEEADPPDASEPTGLR